MLFIGLKILLLFASFFVLWYASERSVHLSSNIAEEMGVSNLFVGFVFLSLATGLPELLVAIQSLIAKQPLLSVGDIIGSNFIDISLALGIAALFIGPIYIEKIDQRKQIFMLLISAVVMAFIFARGAIDQVIGFALLAIYITGIALLYRLRRNIPSANLDDQPKTSWKSILKNGAFLKLAIFIILVIVSAKIAVDNAIDIAHFFTIPMSIIGATLFAAGTSLPEISLNIQAVRKKNYGLALGNSLGSVFNQASLILGILAANTPERLPITHLNRLFPFMFASFGILLLHLILGKKIGRLSGLILISLYVICITYEIMIH